MSKKRRAIEWGKSLLIIALIMSALLLGRASGYGGLLTSGGERLNGSTGDSAESGSAEAAASVRGARPVGIELCFGGGQRGAWIYDDDSVSEVFHRFSAALGEALGSAGEPESVSEAAFRAGLEAEGVCLRLVCAQPLGSLSLRLGAEMSSAASAAMSELLCLCVEEENAALYYMDDEGSFFRCGTAVNAEALQSRLRELQPNGACFAYERDSLAGLESYTIITDTPTERSVVTAESRVPGDSGTEAIFQIFGINGYVVSPYTEADGTVVYIDGEKNLRVSPAGLVSFHSEQGGTVDVSAQDAAEIGWDIVENVLLPYCGAADICLSGITGAEGSYELSFDYMVGGVPVMLSSGHAARVTVKNGEVTLAELTLRCYTLTENTRPLLPISLATAIVASGGSGRLSLVYADSGESVDCIWVTD